MGRHFLSVLGTGSYQDTVYTCNGEKHRTAYVQEALLKMKFGEGREGDRISIFLTQKAKEKNWEGLKQCLAEYSAYLDNQEECMLPVGATEAELWEIFQVIFSRIRENDELYIDITHSLRNIPIQMLAVISYARVVKKVKVKGIYYGAFETKEQFGGETPILNLITFLDILDWSQAADSFVRYGNSDQISELYKAQKHKAEIKHVDLNNVVTDINNITHGLETSRGYYDFGTSRNAKNSSVLYSYRKYKEDLQIMNKKDVSKEDRKEKQKNIIEPLGELLQVIDTKLDVFDVDTNLDLGMAAIQWAIENRKTQQGFTALEETVKTFLCNYYGLDEVSETDRERICKDICNFMYERGLKTKGKDEAALTDDVRHKLCREWVEVRKGRLGITEGEKPIEEMFLTLPTELLDMFHEISDRRNSMNHFGYSNRNKFSCTKLEKDLKEYFEQFKNIMSKMNERKGEMQK